MRVLVHHAKEKTNRWGLDLCQLSRCVSDRTEHPADVDVHAPLAEGVVYGDAPPIPVEPQCGRQC